MVYTDGMRYLGLDIGGTKCAVCAGTTEGDSVRLFARREVPTQSSPQKTLDALRAAGEEMISAYAPTFAGISCGGPLDTAQGIIDSPPNLPGWHGFPVVRYVQETYGLPARLENDANACALAEWRFGAGKGADNVVFFTFGTGLGAGLILGGKLYRGANGNAGEAGHLRLCDRGPIGYGKVGSFEGFCSGGGIAALAAIRAKEKGVSLPDTVTAKALAEAAKGGDAFALSVFEESGEMLGRGLAAVVDLLNPNIIVLGGVFMRSARLLEPAMYRALEREALPESLRACRIVPAALGENIGDIAALAVAEGTGL